jgi:glycerol-3-phosphate acyltransferase PlsX
VGGRSTDRRAPLDVVHSTSVEPAARVAAVALDAMGSTLRPVAEILGAAEATLSGVEVIVVGDRTLLEREMDRLGVRGLFPVLHAPDAVRPSRQAWDGRAGRPTPSMRVALEMVRAGEVAAMASAGNPAALCDAAAATLGLIGGVDLPALAVDLATHGRTTLLCDAGANAACSAQQLLGFARLARAASLARTGAEPTIGLLPSEAAKEARSRFEQSGLDFVGFVEPDDVARGRVDVVVTDGWAGQLVWKTMKAAGPALQPPLRASRARWPAAVGEWLARLALRRRKTEAARTKGDGGGLLLGVAGLVSSLPAASDARAIGAGLRHLRYLAAAGFVSALRSYADVVSRGCPRSAVDGEGGLRPAVMLPPRAAAVPGRPRGR